MAALSGIKGTWMHAWMEDRGVCVVCAWSLSCYHILPFKNNMLVCGKLPFYFQWEYVPLFISMLCMFQ